MTSPLTCLSQDFVFVTKFLPNVVSLLAEEQLHSLMLKLSEKPPPLDTVADQVVSYARTRTEPATVFAYYTIHVRANSAVVADVTSDDFDMF